MIRVTVQDLHTYSPRCATNCSRYVEAGCGNNCTLRFRVSFACPHCKVVKCFYGGSAPQNCSTCKKPLPDMYTIKTDDGVDVRIKYHLKEGA